MCGYGRLRAGVAGAARARSRQEIETCLVKRARRSIHASFWLFHQPARSGSILDAAARGDGVTLRCTRCLIAGTHRWRGRSLRFSAARVHAFGFSCSAAASLAESLRGAVSYATAAKLMLYTNADTRPNGVFRVQRFGCYTAAMASLQLSTEPLALEPKFIERDLGPLLEDSSGTLCCRFATFGQGSTAALSLAQLWIFDVVRLAVTLHARSSTIKPITCCHIDSCLSFASIGSRESTKMTS